MTRRAGLRVLRAPPSLGTAPGEEARFTLRYGSLEVGYLWLSGGAWHFEYSDAFRAQDDVKSLADFPDERRT